MQLDQLATLAAIIDTGSFDGAAVALHITPSAVSQRVKALETATGRVLVRRTTPCEPTAAGAVLVRMAREVALLEADARAALGELEGGPATVAVAVNADSLATWFAPVLAAAARWAGTTVDLEVEDEGHSRLLLRDGAVLGAVTSDPLPVGGCRVEALGSMRYVPVAVPELRDRHTRGGRLDLASLPCLRVNRKDDLQAGYLRDRGVTRTPPTSQIPTSEGFRAAVAAGLGWGMLPEAQLDDDLATGRLVRLAARAHRDVPLYWQAWTLRSPRLDLLTDAVRSAARAGLRPPRGG